MIYTQNVPAGRYGDVYSNLVEIVATNPIYRETPIEMIFLRLELTSDLKKPRQRKNKNSRTKPAWLLQQRLELLCELFRSLVEMAKLQNYQLTKEEVEARAQSFALTYLKWTATRDQFFKLV